MVAKVVLAVLMVLAVLALALQQQLMARTSTLRERLQHMPEQVAGAVSVVATAAGVAGAPTTPHVGQADHSSSTTGTGTGAVTIPHLLTPPPSPPRPPPPPMPAPDGCPRPRRPYHVLLTAASGIYQEWQTRIAYYHYKKLKAQNPCSDIGGFTRLLNTHGARPDALVGEIPTVVVRQLSGGRCDECDHGFIVMNRPFGIRQFVSHAAFRNITEDYLFIVETDHLLLKPLPNSASETQPVGFGFYYMTYRYDPPKLRPVVAKYHDPDAVDPVGPSPVVISKRMLQRVIEPWWQLCLTLKRDPQADRAFGWVLEMWAWALATARLGIRHEVNKQLQAEPGGVGISYLDNYFIYHYTFDIDVPAGWTGRQERYFWSKRRFMGSYPGPLPAAPSAAQRSTHSFVKIMNEAMLSFGAAWAPPRRWP